MKIYPSRRVIEAAVIFTILSGCSDRFENSKDTQASPDSQKRIVKDSGSRAEKLAEENVNADTTPSKVAGTGVRFELLSDKVDCADLCLSIDKTPARPGEALKGKISWSKMPEGAGIVLYFTRKNGSSAEKYHGPSGAIAKKPQTLTAAGQMQFEWNGLSFACAPFDKMEICSERPMPGIYNITAVVFDRSDFDLIGKSDGKSPQRIKGVGSEYFTFKGQPDLKLVADDLRQSGHEKFKAGNIGEDASGIWRDAAVRRSGDDWCAIFKMKAPGRDKMIVCASQKAVMDEFGQRRLSERDVKIVESLK